MGIKNKLALLVTLLFGILLCTSAALLVESSEVRLRESIIAQQAALVKTLTYGFDQQVMARHKMLIEVAKALPPELVQQPARLQAFLQERIILPKMFTNVLVYSPDGTVLAAWPAPEKYVGSRRMAGMEYIAHTVQTRQPYISRLFKSPVSGQPLVVMTAPVLDKDGNVVALFGGSQYILTDNLFSGFTDTHIGHSGNLFLLSQDRTIIAHSDKTRVMEQLEPGANKAIDAALTSGVFAGEAVTSRGTPVLITIETMKTTSWLSGVLLPLDEAYAPINAMRIHALQLLALLLLMLPLLVWWGAGYMTRPLLLLRDRIKNMTRTPQIGTLVALDRHDEIGELARAFDELTLARHSAEEAQLRLNRALRVLSDCNQTLIHADNEAKLLQDICTLIFTSGGYPFVWIGYVDPTGQDKIIHPMAKAGSGAQILETLVLSMDETAHPCELSYLTLQTGERQVCQEIIGDPMFGVWQDIALAYNYHSGISLPLKNEQITFGILNIYAHERDAFGVDEIKLLDELAADLSFGIKTLRARAAHQAAEEELAFLAHHDPLTELPNRLLLRDRFEQAAALAGRNGTRVAMLFLDLDNFKEVNDSLGHGIGDELLIAVVQRLRATLRQADTISREGGDEFVVLVPGINSINDVGRVAQTILDAMTHPFEIEHHTLHTSFSIGISVYPNDGENFDTVRKNADTALYRAKDGGRRNYRFFAGQMNVDAQVRMQMQIDLRKALQNDEFELLYQPQINLRTGRMVGVEALIRWRRNGELVSPAEFIPVAEHSGLIIPIGEWVISEACRQGVEWRRQGLVDMVVAVNLSALQFKHGNIVDTVRLALENSGLPAGSLELELTESILLQDVDAAMSILHRLKELGVHLSIDDFGTGYSSLSYLKRLAVDKLKIDRSFVGDVTEDTDDAAIARAVIQLGHTLQLTVIAEGVETEGQCAFLRESACDEAQGYLFSRPVPPSDIPSLMASLGKAVF
ncbi:MAG TPA: EAL domain-containing protein [Rhodocyclaceae bacterium]|nr:EAL domain-containing protein [Rhodocyclaceae bacterium]